MDDILASIGNTPLIRLRRPDSNPDVAIWAKLEAMNPSGSLKDRIALYMIEQAESRGDLRPGMTIVEATSGNTGIALGMVAAVKGYKLKLFMLESKTIERRRMLRLWGADLVLTTKDDPDSHIYGAKQLVADEPDRYFYIDQNENEDNVLAHHHGTGKELLEQLDGRIDGFLAGYGTGGCLTGVGGCLKEAGTGTKIFAIEPGDEPRAKIDGLKHSSESYQPPIYDRSLLHETIGVPQDEAYRFTRNIASEQGVVVGLSSGAVLWAAEQVAATMDKGNLVVIFGDRGDRYFSTGVFD
jgi:cysteine synthase